MNGKQQLTGWLGVGLILANVVAGALRDTAALIAGGGTHNHGGGGGGGGGSLGGLIPSGPLTGIPFSPISNPAGQPALQPHQAAVHPTYINA